MKSIQYKYKKKKYQIKNVDCIIIEKQKGTQKEDFRW